MRSLTAAAFALALVPFAALAGKTVAIDDPVKVELSTKASAAQVKKAVKLAVLGRKWDIQNEKGSGFHAKYSRTDRNGTIGATIHVEYSPKEVTLKYVNSEGLDAAEGRIHPTYNKWVNFLAKDIPIFVEREVIASE